MSNPVKRKGWPWSLILPVCALVFAVSIQGWGGRRALAPTRAPHLAQLLQSTTDEWAQRDIPLGANEFISGEVEKILRYDDVINREYQRGPLNIGVYVAYWGAGKMPTRLVASHTPDRCWTENGWRCLEMRFKEEKVVQNQTWQPAEWRLFEPPSGGKPIHVLYWHLVEGKVYDYGDRFNAVPDPLRWWQDAVQQAVLGSREQYFIRLTSNAPMEEIWSDPGFQKILKRLESLGLILRPVAAAS